VTRPSTSRFSGSLGSSACISAVTYGYDTCRLRPQHGAWFDGYLAAALFSDGILSGVAACRMADMGKAEFQHMLGERGIPQPLTEPDLAQDLSNLATWNAR